MIRRLDHVAILVESTERALAHFSDHLGLPVVAGEELETPHVRLTYLDAGNAFLQLLEPLGPGPLAEELERGNEGLHHICFGTADPVAEAGALGDGTEAAAGSGRGRVSSFVPGPPRHGVRLECTEFDHELDVVQSPGMLSGEAPPG